MCDNIPFLHSEKDWRCAKYGPLGLIETILKVGGMLVMLASIGLYDPQINRLEVISWSKTALVVVTGVIAFIHILLIPQRLLEREVCAIAFMIASALAHIIAPIIQLTAADPSQYIFCFALLMLFGDIVKLAFLKIEDEFQVHMLSRQNLIFLTSFTAFLYFATLILQGLQWSIDLVVVA
eukprot:TRINITY_DN7466_c0_g1_i1.p2 TRINITY_DN7466_c0_g1~~TRINITY_DN7466_c0_g1_i1.p2  ORF type:complete len:180 (-),score=63.33 TRINITY_DN7466_c0_g1_i1:74-613(-)